MSEFNPCKEISISTSKFLTLDAPVEDPNLTYPTVTKFGIREMTRSQQRSYFEKYVETPAERNSRQQNQITNLEERLVNLEGVLSNMWTIIKTLKVDNKCVQNFET